MLSGKQRKRLALALGALLTCAAIVATILFTLKDNVQLYFTPHAILQGEAPLGRPIRVGGMVVPGSVQRGNNVDVSFVLTDGQSEVTVIYSGALPDLFKEGQGIVAMGTLNRARELKAVQVLAKHDENYMPKEITESLR
jgi:cytochrome c-type biogenesis protein CcmE